MAPLSSSLEHKSLSWCLLPLCLQLLKPSGSFHDPLYCSFLELPFGSKPSCGSDITFLFQLFAHPNLTFGYPASSKIFSRGQTQAMKLNIFKTEQIIPLNLILILWFWSQLIALASMPLPYPHPLPNLHIQPAFIIKGENEMVLRVSFIADTGGLARLHSGSCEN